MVPRSGTIVIIAAAFFLLASAAGAGLFFLSQKGRTVEVPRVPNGSAASLIAFPLAEPLRPTQVSTLTGLTCANTQGGVLPRPMGVMLAGDTVARPLSGIGEADVVIEMPVITDSINRLLAIFQCTAPAEIGSVRSARHDFIPLVAAFDAVYGHWGGSHFALDKLNTRILDNIDALKNPYGAYFRKQGIPSPHNGFTNWDRLAGAAQKLGYRLSTDFSGYPHGEQPIANSQEPGGILQIGYPRQFRVEWRYDAVQKKFLRFRGGTAEIDRNNHTQVAAGTVAVLRTSSRQIEGQYNTVKVTGEGALSIFRFGEEIKGKWQKADTPLSAPLRFIGENGIDIELAPGQLWIEFVQTNTKISFEAKP